SRRPKKRKYFSGYFKDSVVFVCVAISARRRNACEQPSAARRLASRKGGVNNGKETSQRRGQYPQNPNGRWEGQYAQGIDPSTGRAIQKSVSARTQAECKEKLAKAIR